MRFLGIGDSNDLGAMYMRLIKSGHEVKTYVGNAGCREKLRGLVPRTADWERELAWVKAAGRDGAILFETAHMGETQDRLRREGYNVIGGGTFGDRLENDRAFGQHCMRSVGMTTAPTHEFRDFAAADRFVARTPGRYVYKPNGAHLEAQESYVGELDDGSDLRAILRREKERRRGTRPDFVLMRRLAGVEVGVGAYFNGERFLDQVCIDWEHKRFFDGDVGEMTGEMGTLVSYRNSGPLFAATLGRMTEMLRASGYVGYINLNTIVDARGVWPLEFTCRFGYPGFAILECLHEDGWDRIFARMIARRGTSFRTRPGFAVGVVLTVPPFPLAGDGSSAQGLPIRFRGALTGEDRSHLHFDEVQSAGGKLSTSGPTGYVMVVTGRGRTVEKARSGAYSLMRRVVVPNGRYRSDIGLRFIRRDRALMQRWGLWPRAARFGGGPKEERRVR